MPRDIALVFHYSGAMSKTDKKNLICVAAIAGAFGVRGEVKVKAFTDDPAACLLYGPLLDEAGNVALTPISSRAVKNALAVIAKEVKTREEAEALKSTKLYVPRDAFPNTDEDDFYVTDLVGLQVKTTDGKTAGKVTAVHDFGGGNMLEIKPKDKSSFYHPFTKLAVPKVDINAGRVIITIVEPEIVPEQKHGEKNEEE